MAALLLVSAIMIAIDALLNTIEWRHYHTLQHAYAFLDLPDLVKGETP